MTETAQNWASMLDHSARLLHERTGAGLDEWNRRVRDSGCTDEPALRDWLAGRGVTGYAQMMLVMERFGYPDYLLAGADELIDAQYRDRERLRPIYDAVVATAVAAGEVTIQARKTYVSLVSPRRTFGLVRAATKSRVDLGLRLPDQAAGGRLLVAKRLDPCNVRIALTDPAEVDDEVARLLEYSYGCAL